MNLGFSVLNNGVVYKNSDDKLYYYDGNQPTTLGKDVYSFRVDTEKNRVMYYTADDNGDFTLYFVDLKKPDESTKLVSSVYSLVSTQNLDHILYYKQNDDDESILYSVDTAGNTEKLVDDYETVTYGDDALYYLGASGETYSLASVLSDADNYTLLLALLLRPVRQRERL